MFSRGDGVFLFHQAGVCQRALERSDTGSAGLRAWRGRRCNGLSYKGFPDGFDTLFEVPDVDIGEMLLVVGVNESCFFEERVRAQIKRFKDIGPELFTESGRVARAVPVVFEAIGNNDHQMQRVETEFSGFCFDCVALIPVIEPVFTVVVIEGEEASHPHDWIPFLDTEGYGYTGLFIRYVEGVELVDILKDTDSAHGENRIFARERVLCGETGR